MKSLLPFRLFRLYGIVLCVMLHSTTSRAQEDYKNVFENLINQGEWEAVPSLLAKWQTDFPTDPEFFIAKFNYYFHESRSEVMQISTIPPAEGEAITILDSVNSEPVGYMFNAIVYDDDLFAKAIEVIDEGLKLHPNRLDMHFGRIYVLGQRGEIEPYVSSVIALIEAHAKLYKEWRWKGNQPVEDIDQLFTGTIQEHCYKLFNAQEPYLESIEQISIRMTQLYPSDVKFYSNIGACMLMKERFPDALTYFLQANEKLVDDPIVLANIAYTYLALEDTKSAKQYYQRLAEVGNDEQSAFARAQLEQL